MKTVIKIKPLYACDKACGACGIVHTHTNQFKAFKGNTTMHGRVVHWWDCECGSTVVIDITKGTKK